MKLIPLVVLLLALAVRLQGAEISLNNLKGFFWATYDRDNDGEATVQ